MISNEWSSRQQQQKLMSRLSNCIYMQLMAAIKIVIQIWSRRRRSYAIWSWSSCVWCTFIFFFLFVSLFFVNVYFFLFTRTRILRFVADGHTSGTNKDTHTITWERILSTRSRKDNTYHKNKSRTPYGKLSATQPPLSTVLHFWICAYVQGVFLRC